jgi:hypothetical protein
MKKLKWVFFLFFSILVTYSPAVADLIDLNNFFADPSVTVAADGSSAVFNEDPLLGFVLLANDPGLGDPAVITPALGKTLLSFNYTFTLGGPSEEDEFLAFVVDPNTGGSLGPSFEFLLSSSGSGTVSFDLSPFIGNILGLQFQLSALLNDGGFSSIASVSNVQLAEVTQPVPEPASMLLFGTGLVTYFLYSKRKKKETA